jgi:tetratricopeptide (TPR) repeat protein
MKAVIFFLLAIVPTCFGSGQAPCNDLLDSGDASYAIFDNLKALDYYAKAYKECPNIFHPLMKMTRALIDVGEDFNDTGSQTLYREAMRFTDTLQFRYPDSAQSYFLKSIAAANLFGFVRGKKKLELAQIVRNNAEKSIELAPLFAPAYVVLGSYYRRVATAGALQKMLARILYGNAPSGTLQDSRRTLIEALRLSPENIYGCLELARTLIALGEKKEAIDLLGKIQYMPVAWHLDKKLKHEAELLFKRNSPG